jgi:hypothetical protein
MSSSEAGICPICGDAAAKGRDTCDDQMCVTENATYLRLRMRLSVKDQKAKPAAAHPHPERGG